MSADVWVRVHDQRAVVGPTRRRRGVTGPPNWLVLGERPSDGPAPTVAFGSFEVADGELANVRIISGPVSDEMLAALLEAGRSQWARRPR